MGFGFSIVLIAAGAILRFAVEPARSVAGTSVNWDVVGDVLMVVGGGCLHEFDLDADGESA